MLCVESYVMCRKRSSKWDKAPERDSRAESGHNAETEPRKREKRSTKSKWDRLPDDSSNCDQGPSESKWDIRPEDVTEEESSAVTSTAGGSGMAAVAEAAARVNAMLMAKGTLKPAEPLLVNDAVFKARHSVSRGTLIYSCLRL